MFAEERDEGKKICKAKGNQRNKGVGPLCSQRPNERHTGARVLCWAQSGLLFSPLWVSFCKFNRVGMMVMVAAEK